MATLNLSSFKLEGLNVDWTVRKINPKALPSVVYRGTRSSPRPAGFGDLKHVLPRGVKQSNDMTAVSDGQMASTLLRT